jgi:hypothetical protein
MHNAIFDKGFNPLTKLIPILSNATKKLNKEDSYSTIVILDRDIRENRYLK